MSASTAVRVSSYDSHGLRLTLRVLGVVTVLFLLLFGAIGTSAGAAHHTVYDGPTGAAVGSTTAPAKAGVADEQVQAHIRHQHEHEHEPKADRYLRSRASNHLVAVAVVAQGGIQVDTAKDGNSGLNHIQPATPRLTRLCVLRV